MQFKTQEQSFKILIIFEPKTIEIHKIKNFLKNGNTQTKKKKKKTKQKTI